MTDSNLGHGDVGLLKDMQINTYVQASPTTQRPLVQRETDKIRLIATISNPGDWPLNLVDHPYSGVANGSARLVSTGESRFV